MTSPQALRIGRTLAEMNIVTGTPRVEGELESLTRCFRGIALAMRARPVRYPGMVSGPSVDERLVEDPSCRVGPGPVGVALEQNLQIPPGLPWLTEVLAVDLRQQP